MFEKTVLQLQESNSVTFCELYPIMSQLGDKLKDRFSDMFFGAVATQILDMPCSKKTATEKNFCDALQRGIDYLEKWFDFGDKNVAFMLQSLSLKCEAPTFQQVKNICAALHLMSTCMTCMTSFPLTKRHCCLLPNLQNNASPFQTSG